VEWILVPRFSSFVPDDQKTGYESPPHRDSQTPEAAHSIFKLETPPAEGVSCQCDQIGALAKTLKTRSNVHPRLLGPLFFAEFTVPYCRKSLV